MHIITNTEFNYIIFMFIIQMKTNLDSGYTDVIRDDSNPHDVAAVFKEFLRCLPDPLLTRDLYPAFLAAASKLNNFFLIIKVIQISLMAFYIIVTIINAWN